MGHLIIRPSRNQHYCLQFQIEHRIWWSLSTKKSTNCRKTSTTMMMSYNELTRVNKDRMTRTSPSSFFLFRFPSKLRPCWFFRRFITDLAPPCQAYSIFIYKLRRINDNERAMRMMMTFAASISFTTKSVRMASRCKVPLVSHII